MSRETSRVRLATLGAGVALLLLAPVFAFAADPRVKQALEAEGVKYEVDGDGDFRVVLAWSEDNRSQLVFVNSATELLGRDEIREVWSMGYKKQGESVPVDIQVMLLKANATYKIGAWEASTNSGVPVARFTARIPAGSTSSFLVEVIRTVAATCDEMEKELLGSDEL